jgi:hypothetical protein
VPASRFAPMRTELLRIALRDARVSSLGVEGRRCFRLSPPMGLPLTVLGADRSEKFRFGTLLVI